MEAANASAATAGLDGDEEGTNSKRWMTLIAKSSLKNDTIMSFSSVISYDFIADAKCQVGHHHVNHAGQIFYGRALVFIHELNQE